MPTAAVCGRRAAVSLLAALPGMAWAQGAWPERPIRIIVPFPPGGSNDILARPLADRLQQRLGRPVVVENRGGAGGMIGAAALVQAPPDGYTFMVTSTSFVTAALVQPVGFTLPQDVTPVALLARSPFVIVAAPSVPAADLPGFVAAARAQPDAFTYGSAGPGSINHFLGAAFAAAAGIRMTHVPYRGMAPAITDLIAGRISLLVTTLPSAAAMIREGRIRLLAYTDQGAPAGSPPAPTAREQGVDVTASIWWGLFAPRGLPAPILARMHAETNAVLADPEVARLYLGEGALPDPRPAEAFAAFLAEEVARYRRIADTAGIREGG
jgi:tripartite-type tricarboxylate transporter receptor subunit TctC